MKIAIVTETLNTHSGSRAPIDLAVSCVQFKNQVIIFAVKKNTNHKLKKELQKKGVQVQLLSTSKFKSFFQLILALRKFAPGIISFHGTLSSFLGAKLSDTPIVKTYYGTQLNAYFERIFPKEPGLLDKFLNFLANQIILFKERVQFWLSDEIVAVSKFTKEEAKKLHKKKVPFVYLGAGNLGNPTKIPNIPKNFILSVSRFTPYKGFHDLIKASQNFPLVITGSVQNKKYLNYLRKNCGLSCKILTDITDSQLAYLYKKCLFLASFDRLPFFGLPIVEAASFGKPAIALKFGAVNELIVNGKAGFVVKNVDEFFQKTKMFFAKPALAKKMGQVASERVKKIFNWQNTAQNYNDFFQKVLTKKQVNSQFLLPLLLVIFGGLILRVVYLTHHDFWFDEAFSYFIAKQNLTDLTLATAADNNPPFYYYLLHFWLKISDVTEIAQRLLSTFFGVLTIPVIYFLAKEVFDKRTGILATLFAGLSPLFIYFSTETRMYALVTFLLIVSTFFLMRWLKTQKNSTALGLILAYSAALYTNYYSFLFLIPFNLIFIQKKYKNLFLKFFILESIALITTLPWLILYFANQHPPVLATQTQIAIPATFASFILGGTGIVTLREFFSFGNLPVSALFTIVLIFFGVIFLYGILKLQKLPGLKLALLFLISPLIFLGILNLVSPIFSVRGTIILAPFFYLIIAAAILRFKRQLRKFLILTTTSLLIIVDLVQFLDPNFTGPQLSRLANSLSEAQTIAHTSILTYYPFVYYQGETKNFLITKNPLTRKTSQIIGVRPLTVNEIKDNFVLVEFKSGANLQEVLNIKLAIIKNFNLVKIQNYNKVTFTHFSQ